MSSASSPIAVLAALCLALAGPACTEQVDGGTLIASLEIASVEPDVLLPGSRLIIHGQGFVLPEVASLLVIVQGAVGAEAVEFAIAPERLDEGTLSVRVTGPVEQALIREDALFTGRVIVLRTPQGDLPEEAAFIDISRPVRRHLEPRLDAVLAEALYPMDTLSLRGDAFVLDGEGVPLVEFHGVMNTANPLRATLIEGLQVPGVVPEGSRAVLDLTLTPDVLGIIPGVFEGELRVVNAFPDGATRASEPVAVSLRLEAPRIDGVSPESASRGAWVRVSGRGFMPPDGLLQAAMVLQLEGRFVPRSGPVQEFAGPTALSFVPDAFSGNTLMSIVLRVTPGPDGQLTGLGATPGRFSGTVTPLTLLGPDRVRGTPFPFGLEILPQRQIVYLRALPSFDDALEEFGLLAEKEAVKARILEACTRDYAGISVAFTWDPPRDFAEYGIVEIAGRDPNGSGLFGLDNTAGKDVGNLRFDDVVGGYNADTSQDGYAAYGGVFPAEFLQLSTRLGTHPLASSRFDDIFEGVSPLLGGRPAEPFESEERGARADEILEAVRVFGNLVANTISHEVGHTLGLAAYDGQFHNPGDNPGWIMDSGTFRPFAERAEIDGQGPSFFGPPSRAYLESILPVD